jgi:hypothetical protein
VKKAKADKESMITVDIAISRSKNNPKLRFRYALTIGAAGEFLM